MSGLSFSSRAWLGWWRRLRGQRAPVALPRKEPVLPQGAFAADVAKVAPAAVARADVFAPYRPPRGVRANNSTAPLAMDSAAAQNAPGLLDWLRPLPGWTSCRRRRWSRSAPWRNNRW